MVGGPGWVSSSTKDAGPLKLKCWNAKNCRFFCLKAYPSTNMKIPRRRNLSFQMYLLFLSTACFISLRVSDLSILCWFPGILANLDLRCKESQFISWFRYQQYQIKSDQRSWKKTGLFTEQPMFVVAGKTPSESLYSDLKYVNPMWNSGFSSTSKPPEPFLQWSISMGTVC